MSEQTEAAVEKPLHLAIGRLSRRLTAAYRADPGEIAALRRAGAGTSSPVFWRVLMADVPEELRKGHAGESLWAGLFTAFAVLAPLGSGRGEALGKALAETGYSELRLVRLLRADSAAMAGELATAARWLVAKGRAADWRDFAEFALSRLDLGADSDHPAARHIARTYFRAVSRPEDPTA